MIAAFFASRLGLGVLTGIVFIAVMAFVVHGIREDGAEAERATITHQNTEAGNVGEGARLSRSDCIARGLRYDFATGHCQRGS